MLIGPKKCLNLIFIKIAYNLIQKTTLFLILDRVAS